MRRILLRPDEIPFGVWETQPPPAPGAGRPIRNLGYPELARLAEQREHCTLVTLVERSMATTFLAGLEYWYFPPGTPANDRYRYFICSWLDGLKVIACVIPWKRRGLAERT